MSRASITNQLLDKEDGDEREVSRKPDRDVKNVENVTQRRRRRTKSQRMKTFGGRMMTEEEKEQKF